MSGLRKLIKYHEKRLLRCEVVEPYSSLEIITRRKLKMPFDIWKRPEKWPSRLSVHEIKLLDQCFRRRATHYPLQYILGVWHFAELSVKVKPPVLIPRPETPQIVDICQSLIEDKTNSHFLEIGTGSGVISCLLLSRDPTITGEGVDISSKCTRLTSQNLTRTLRGPWQHRYKLFHTDFSAHTYTHPYDFVVSNPPYIGQAEYIDLARQVRMYESRRALLSADDGLHTAWSIVAWSRHAVRCGGFVAMELSDGLICRLEMMGGRLEAMGFRVERVYRDCYGERRFVVLRRVGE